MTDDPDPRRHQLPESENERIFRDEIVPEQLGHAQPATPPTAVFVIAQQGAGKTRASAQVTAVLDQRGGFIDVDSDLYKPYHPRYDELLAADDRLMALYTRPDGQVWMRKVQHHVREHGLNAIIQEVGGNPPYNAQVMRDFRAAGHRVEVMMLGVPEAMSRQGILSRYHQQIFDRGRGRLTVAENHTRAYAGIPGLARLIDEHHLADEVAVLRRGESAPRYANRLGPGGRWVDPPGLAEAVGTERARPWTRRESAMFLDSHQVLATGRPAERWSPTIAGILDREAPRPEAMRRPDVGIGADFHGELTEILELASPLVHPDLQPDADRLTTQLAAAAPAIDRGPGERSLEVRRRPPRTQTPKRVDPPHPGPGRPGRGFGR